jgi:hypothetical protein
MSVSLTGFVTGHDFAGAEKHAPALFCWSFVTGHDFSRAENEPYKPWALAPEEPLQRRHGVDES